MLGDEAYQLAQEAKRIDGENLIPYNNNQVSLIVRQSKQLWNNVEKLAKLVELAQAEEAVNANNEMSISNQNSSQYGIDSSQITNSTAKTKGYEQDNGFDQDQEMLENNVEKQNSKSLTSQLVLNHLTVYRNKRVLMAYHSKRCESLRKVAWGLNLNPYLLSIPNNVNNNTENSKNESVSDSSRVNNYTTGNTDSRIENGSSGTNLMSVSSNITVFERNFVQEYSQITKSYREKVEASLGDDIDLDWTASLEKPPRDLFIEVRVLQECGEIQTEFGTVNLEKGSQHYLRRSDVENLINLGYLQHIT
ncbi:hypothetical protein BB559_000819 [Furculomyces boomerangus]|uniref:DNA replication complex GINS protein PSF1 n=2 Tax=Harpellales TaxID=61421 RepID=A0A2T9Z448_9FUNG|nr:hypothetical protein BB559_000819 [Furculomyces boomerangus]PVZ99605.1 hypothetical protein BB558_004370 [Smittium angustum]